MVKQALCFLSVLTLTAAQAWAGKDLSESDFLGEPPVVLTASRMAQSVMDAPNAVTVLDHETIIGSGYTRIADLFRLIPGMYVGEMTGTNMTVSHSFVDQLERRMQVMIDGRSVYLPTFGGVDWDSLPLAIGDIERIEVVRGSNAASYGANAFTGIINIISRHPADVEGRMLSVLMGNHGQREGQFRWAGGNQRYQHRVTLGHREDDGLTNQDDDSQASFVNYRGDANLDARQTFSLQIAGSKGKRQDKSLDFQSHDNFSLQVDYRRQLDEANALLVKFYDSRLHINKVVSSQTLEEDQLGDRKHIELQLDSQRGPDLRATVGGYLRRDMVRSLFYFNTSDELSVDSNGVFGVVEWRPASQWLLNAGAFYENYSLIGGKLSPRLALSWQPSENHTLRAGVSRAYRNPVLYEDDGVLRRGALMVHIGESDLKPELMLSREIAYLGRWPDQQLSADLRLFHDNLENYIGFHLGALTVGNWGNAEQKGFEGQLKWQPRPHTQVIANYAEFHIDSTVTNNDTVGLSAPRKMMGLHVMHRLPKEIDINFSQYWISDLTPIGETHPVEAHRILDVGVHKHFRMASNSASLGVFWQNLTGSYTSLEDSPRNLVDRRAVLRFQLEF